MAKDVLLRLGSYTFSISTAAYEELTRTSEYLWPDHPIVGTAPVLQFTGEAAETMQLRGKIYPGRTGNPWEVANFRALAAKGEPQFLTAGTGRTFGRWVVTNVSETFRQSFSDGTPRAIEFSLSLKRYDDKTRDRTAGRRGAGGDIALNLTTINTGNIA